MDTISNKLVSTLVGRYIVTLVSRKIQKYLHTTKCVFKLTYCIPTFIT